MFLNLVMAANITSCYCFQHMESSERKYEINTHTVEQYLVMQRKALPFATTWMDFEGIMLSKINQTKTDIV